MSHVASYFDQAKQITATIDYAEIEKMAEALAALRTDGGRLFFIGVGGSAGNCGHAVNDFRKLCGFEAYAPTDNVSELTARSQGRSIAVLPFQFSRCLRPIEPTDAQLFRVNGIQTGILFAGSLDLTVRFQFGLFGSAECRKEDAAEMVQLGVLPSVKSGVF